MRSKGSPPPPVPTATAAPGWLTIDEIAAATGLNRSSVSRRVVKFEADGLVSTRVVGGRKLVDRTSYDRACALSIDATQATNASGRKRRDDPAEPREPHALASAQARRVQLQADLLDMRLKELKASLIPADEVGDAMATAAGAMARVLETIPAHSDELAAAIVKDGVAGARAFLKAWSVTSARGSP